MTPTRRQRTGSLTKTARLMILQKMDEAGAIDSMTRESLADLLQTTRATIQRDLRDLQSLQPIYTELLQKVEQS